MHTHKFPFTLLVFALQLSIFAQTTQSGDTVSLNSAGHESRTYNEIMADGIDAFYQTDWEGANKDFELMQQLVPDDPKGYFFASMIPFWEYFFVKQTPELAEQFMAESGVAIRVGKEELRKHPDDTAVVAMLSGLYGYQSLVSSGENNIRSALRAGRTGFGYTQMLLEYDENMPEVNIGRGIYHYMVGSVPGALKWLTRLFGLNGDVETGYSELKKAAESESHVSADAKMILAYLYNREERFDESLDYLSALREMYQKNTIFHFVYAKTLENKGDVKKAIEEYNKLIEMDNPNLVQLTEMSRENRDRLIKE